MCHYAEFGCSRSNRVRIAENPQNWGNAALIEMEGVADRLKTSLPILLPRLVWSFFFKECIDRQEFERQKLGSVWDWAVADPLKTNRRGGFRPSSTIHRLPEDGQNFPGIFMQLLFALGATA